MEPQSTIMQPVIGSSNTSKLQFKKSQLLLVAAVFAVIGIIVLVMSFAFTPTNGDFEAETMTLEAL